MNILVTLPAGILIILAMFIAMKKLAGVSTLVTGSVLALLVIAVVSVVSILDWPGADVFAIHLSLYLMTVYASSIIARAREDITSGRQGGFHWGPALIIGFFAIVIITNTFFILLAQSDGSVSWVRLIVPEPVSGGETKSVFPGTVSHDFRERENQFNEYRLQREQQTARGWKVKTGWETKAVHNSPAKLLVEVKDADGNLITDANVTGKFLYVADYRYDRIVTLQPGGKGLYSAEITLPQPGNWNLVLNVIRGEEKHELRVSTTVD